MTESNPDPIKRNTILSIRDVTVDIATPSLPGTPFMRRILDRVSLSVPQGKTLAIVGESGSGKSVLSQTILQLLPREAEVVSGSIHFDPAPAASAPTDILALPPNGATIRSLRGRAIAMIFQEPMTALSPLHTVGSQIMEAIRIHRTARPADMRAMAREMMRRAGFHDPDQALALYPFELSGGMRQRAVIAMALVCKPDILIADEPTTALDVTTQAKILDLLNTLQDELGTTILLITHDFGVVAAMADEVAVMHQGQIVETGMARQIFKEARHPYVKALLKAVPRLRVPEKDPRPPSATPGTPVLSVSGLTKTFYPKRSGTNGASSNPVVAARDVSFTLHQGECLALVGESGSGKSTTAKLIMGATRPDRGTIFFHGDDSTLAVHSSTRRQLKPFRRQVQYVFQDPFSALNPNMSVWDILREPMVIHKTHPPAEQAARIRHVLSLVDLDPDACARFPHAFSGGQRQRIGIARALIPEPTLLLLDEPTSSLDVSVQAQVIELLRDLRARLGLTYLFVSHDLAVVNEVADRIGVMCRGRIVEIAPKHALFTNPLHPYTKALEDAILEPDPEHRRRLAAAGDTVSSDSSTWPAPYGLAEEEGAVMVEQNGGHWVAVSPTTYNAELRETA